MKKLELPVGNHWALNSDLQIRLDPIDNVKAVTAHLRSINKDNWHGSPIGNDIIVNNADLKGFLNAHSNDKNIIGYRYYGGNKSKLKGVILSDIAANKSYF